MELPVAGPTPHAPRGWQLPSWPMMGTWASAGPFAGARPPGTQSRSQSLGGDSWQQHGQRRTTGSSPKYREPLPPSWDPGGLGGGWPAETSGTPARTRPSGPPLSPVLEGGEPGVCQAVRLMLLGTPRLPLPPPGELGSYHMILRASCLLFPLGGQVGAWGFSNKGPSQRGPPRTPRHCGAWGGVT